MPILDVFTIESTRYAFENGMTCGEWVNSSYNTGWFYILDGKIKTTGTNFVSTVNSASTTYAVSTTDTITKDVVYYLPTITTDAPIGGGTGN